jgi:hypothetical protein
MNTKEELNYDDLTYNELDQLIAKLQEIREQKKNYFEVTVRVSPNNAYNISDEEIIDYVYFALKNYNHYGWDAKSFTDVEIISVSKVDTSQTATEPQ